LHPQIVKDEPIFNPSTGPSFDGHDVSSRDGFVCWNADEELIVRPLIIWRHDPSADVRRQLGIRALYFNVCPATTDAKCEKKSCLLLKVVDINIVSKIPGLSHYIIYNAVVAIGV